MMEILAIGALLCLTAAVFMDYAVRWRRWR